MPHLGAPMTMKRGLHGAPDGQTGEADAAARASDGHGGAIGGAVTGLVHDMYVRYYTHITTLYIQVT